jgi:hypothetical protein
LARAGQRITEEQPHQGFERFLARRELSPTIAVLEHGRWWVHPAEVGVLTHGEPWCSSIRQCESHRDANTDYTSNEPGHEQKWQVVYVYHGPKPFRGGQ